ncbi:D-alanyl-D-alanine carboxypeptidase family protein [Erythrobacter aurantius]|uniref:D-alanyl-D-alanine carboxypeptidase family protein n=1 Tax=Erythrobacter aurantius TaxID=2909249 RepID=UPI002079B813|nr:D-alanyl-D-alanine carboxypeptidase family protein [Erythrobacter aurantius]
MFKRLSKWLALASALLLAATTQAQPAAVPPPEDEVPIALLVDLTSGQVLHQRNADRRFVPASITKVMTLFRAFELIAAGKLVPAQTFTMRDETWREWSGEGSTMWIGEGEPVSVHDMLTGIANVSANDAAAALAEGQAGSVDAWVAAMNEEARRLGMTQSHFGTPNGWPDEGRTFTTAHDLVKLARAMITRHPELYARYIGKRGFRFNGIEQSNHDPLIGRTQGADGIKTGYTNEAGFGYLGSVERDGQRLVLVVAGVERSGTRARAARNYIEWGFSAFERRRVFGEQQVIGEARVQGGDARRVGLRTDRTVYVNVPRGTSGELSMSISYDGPLRAPFSAGDRVATLVIEVRGMEPARVPLLATDNVEKAGVFARMLNGIAGWFS